MTPLKEYETRGGTYRAHKDALIEPGAVIGLGTTVWAYAHIFPRAIVGEHCVIGEGVGIENDARLGSFSKIQTGARLYGGVTTGEYVFIGPNATTTNDRNPRAFGDWEKTSTIIETGASIGANSTIIAGNRIGALSLVAAGAVVSRDVEAGSLVAGNPARFHGWVDVSGKIISREAERPQELSNFILSPDQVIKNYLKKHKGF